MPELFDHEDDDPVIIERRACADCRKANTPLNSEDRCDSCAERYETLLRREFDGWTSEGETLTFRYSVEIQVHVKDRSIFELLRARLRAAEVLLGYPMVGDQETWSHELIVVEDEDGEEVPRSDVEPA